MEKCAYCKDQAIGKDAIGLPACKSHLAAADDYVKQNATRTDAATNGQNRWPIEEIPDCWLDDLGE